MVEELDPIFSKNWPIRVEVVGDSFDQTTAFAWLWREVFKLDEDHKEVFTTFGRCHVAFKPKYRRLAIHFKLRFG